MKFNVKFEIEADDLPTLERKLREVLSDLADFEDDLLRQEMEQLDDSNPNVIGWYNDFDYEVEI